MIDLHAEISALSRSINEHQRHIAASPFADCTNCGSSSHMAALTGICLGCEMAARSLFDFIAAHFGGNGGNR